MVAVSGVARTLPAQGRSCAKAWTVPAAASTESVRVRGTVCSWDEGGGVTRSLPD